MRKALEKNLHITGCALDMLMKLVVFEDHLPTGAPTSPILAILAHLELFDGIYKKMQKAGIKMTIYFDDISLSSEKHIGDWAIKFCKRVLKLHGLWLKSSKIKRFGYKAAWVTGIRITQAGKLDVPFRLNYSVVKMLRAKEIDQMSKTELRKLLGKIGCIQQIHRNSFNVTKQQARKKLKQLQRLQNVHTQKVQMKGEKNGQN